ncbi:MAG: hypothetical protein ACFFCS_13910 [Candidatus Hodarchaeota archaeon]
MSPAERGYLQLKTPGHSEAADDTASGDQSSYYVSHTCTQSGEWWFYVSPFEYSFSSYTYTITVSGATSNTVPGYDTVTLFFFAISTIGLLAWLVVRKRRL